MMELPGASHGDMGLQGLLVGKLSGKLFRRGWGEFANLESVMDWPSAPRVGKEMKH